MNMVRARHPEVAETILHAVEARHEVPSIQAINQSRYSLLDAGFAPPTWDELATETVHLPNAENGEPNQPRVGGAMLRSQGVPLASAPFVSLPTNRTSRLEPQLLRVLFLRRLRFSLNLSARACRCGRPLDVFGHHRSACVVAGTLGRRGFPLENAAARICREAGGRVRTNVFVRDLDLGVVDQFDTRRLEVLVDGLPLFQGAQLAVDTTLVCPLTREGEAKPHTATTSGVRLEVAKPEGGALP